MSAEPLPIALNTYGFVWLIMVWEDGVAWLLNTIQIQQCLSIITIISNFMIITKRLPNCMTSKLWSNILMLLCFHNGHCVVTMWLKWIRPCSLYISTKVNDTYLVWWGMDMSLYRYPLNNLQYNIIHEESQFGSSATYNSNNNSWIITTSNWPRHSLLRASRLFCLIY